MKTLLFNSPADLPRAAALLQAGEVVAIPTETVYGLAANALDPVAVQKIFAAKNRPADNPLIVHIPSADWLPRVARAIPDAALALAKAYWPGPLTMVLPRTAAIPNVVTAGGDTVAVRLPSHPDARAIIEACGLPLAAPSANRSGSPSPTTAAHVLADMDGRIAAVYDGGPCSVGVESTVVSLVGDRPRLLRPGGITPAMLQAVLGDLVIDPSVTQNVQLDRVSSPGMKYRHYAPRARVTLVRAGSPAFVAFVNRQTGPGTAALCFAEELPAVAIPALSLGPQDRPEEQARRLFACLRALDDQNITRVFVHCPDPTGVGLAVYNRLLRAAAFEEMELES